MDFDLDKIRAYYETLKSERDIAVANALNDLDAKIEERIAEEKVRIAEEVKQELVAEAEKPYAHDIELCEKFVKDEPVEEIGEEANVEENIENAGE